MRDRGHDKKNKQSRGRKSLKCTRLPLRGKNGLYFVTGVKGGKLLGRGKATYSQKKKESDEPTKEQKGKTRTVREL